MSETQTLNWREQQMQQRIAELEQELAIERASKQHESARAQALMQERNAAIADARALAQELGEKLYDMRRERLVSIGSIDSHYSVLFSKEQVEQSAAVMREHGAKYLKDSGV